MGYFVDDFGVTGKGVITGMVALIALITIVAWELNVSYYKSNCDNYAKNTGSNTRFERPRWGQAFCYVETPNGWFQIEQVNQNSVTGEVK